MSKELAEVMEENGIVYHLAEDGYYYPDWTLEQKTDYPIGKYGIMRAEYMWENCKGEYFRMVREGTCNQYLHEVDEECHREVELAVERSMKKEGVTEQLKRENQLEWVRRVNEIRERAEEVVITRILFN
jgi:hypothetical protein